MTSGSRRDEANTPRKGCSEGAAPSGPEAVRLLRLKRCHHAWMHRQCPRLCNLPLEITRWPAHVHVVREDCRTTSFMQLAPHSAEVMPGTAAADLAQTRSPSIQTSATAAQRTVTVRRGLTACPTSSASRGVTTARGRKPVTRERGVRAFDERVGMTASNAWGGCDRRSLFVEPPCRCTSP